MVQRQLIAKENEKQHLSDEGMTRIGKYATENGAAVCHFRTKYPDLGDELANKGDYTSVTSIPSEEQGWPLTLSDLDSRIGKVLV